MVKINLIMNSPLIYRKSGTIPGVGFCFSGSWGFSWILERGVTFFLELGVWGWCVKNSLVE
jgi:hypothetical protein